MNDNNNICEVECGLIMPPLSISTIKNNNNNICECNGGIIVTSPPPTTIPHNNNNDIYEYNVGLPIDPTIDPIIDNDSDVMMTWKWYNDGDVIQLLIQPETHHHHQPRTHL